MKYTALFILTVLLAAVTCKTPEDITPPTHISSAAPPVIVYKTKKSTAEYVAVEMSREKNRVVSYPAPSDIRNRGGAVLPDSLDGGYLLDNRGIGPDVVFLDLTYEKYATLPHTPAPEELFQYITEEDPLLEMYRCPLEKNSDHLIDTLNQWIRSGMLYRCKRLH